MKFYCNKILFSLIISFFLIGCKESTETPPFVFDCYIQLTNEDGSSLFLENKDKIKLISVKLQKPLEAKVSPAHYLEYRDYLFIQISEWDVANRNKGNSEQEYIVEIKYPDEIRKETDIFRIKYQFKDYRPSVVEAFYNDQEAQQTDSGAIFFKIKN